MTLDWVLHARYMTPSVDRGTNNYGGQDYGSSCLQDDKKEQPFTSNTADVSRNTFNYFSGNTQVYLEGAPSGLGGMNGTIETGNGNKQAVNRAANFLNNDYALIGDKIYKYDRVALKWNDVLTLTGKTATSTSSLGLYPVEIGGVPFLVTAWSVGDGSTWSYAKLNGDTDAWTTSPAIAGGLGVSDANGGILTEIQHGSKIYYATSSETSFGYYDFLIGSFGTNSFGTTSRHPMDFCSFMGNLYILNKNATNNAQILKASGVTTAFETLLFDTNTPSAITGIDVGDTLTTTSQFEGRPLFFVDNVYDSGNGGVEPTLWAYYVTHASTAGHLGDGVPSTIDTNHGLIAQPLRLSVSGTLESISVPSGAALPVIGFRANPFKMMHNQEGTFLVGLATNSRKDEDMVLRVFIDQKDRGQDGLGRSSIVCASRFAGQRGCTGSPGGGGDFGNLMYHVFKGSGNTDGGLHPNPPTKDGGAHAFDFIGIPAKQARHRALPHSRLGGGARHSEIDASGNPLADIVYRGSAPGPTNGTIRIFYSIVPSSGKPLGSSVDVRWWHDKNSHAPETACTLLASSHGSGISGVLATQIPITSGTIYYVDWAAKADGIIRNKRYSLDGQINVADTQIGQIADPTDLDGLVSWYESDDGSTVTVEVGVSGWQDKSGATSGLFQATTGNQPSYATVTNNGIPGVTFDNTDFLFSSSGSPLTGGPGTICIVYETDSSPANSTMLSLADDLPQGTGNLTNVSYWNVNLDGASTLSCRDQDFLRAVSGTPSSERVLTVPSGGAASKTRCIIWRNTSFEGLAQLFPSGQAQETEFTTDGAVEPTGLSNLTFGRFSGGQISGVYSTAGSQFNGTMYEIAMYSRILPDSEVNRWRLYAEDKYNLDA